VWTFRRRDKVLVPKDFNLNLRMNVERSFGKSNKKDAIVLGYDVMTLHQ